MDSQFWMPHGGCYFWNPWILTMEVVGNGLMSVTYLTLGLLMVHASGRRFAAHILWFPAFLWAFGTFIALCGVTHALKIAAIWYPNYQIYSSVTLLAGGWSAFTGVWAILNWPKLRTFLLERRE